MPEWICLILLVRRPTKEVGKILRSAVFTTLPGSRNEGQAIFDAANAKKADSGNWMRIGRVYWEAKDWAKAKVAFDKALAMEPKDAPWLAEIGAYYNLRGDRAKAEELFDRSFALNSDEVWQTANIAGSYLGVEPLH